MPLQTEYNKDTIKESILNKLLRYYGCTIEDATAQAGLSPHVASTVRDQIMLKWTLSREGSPPRRTRPSGCITFPSSF